MSPQILVQEGVPLTGRARYISTALPLRQETWTFLSSSPIHRQPRPQSEVGPSAFVCYCRTSIKLVDFIPTVESKSKKSKKLWPGWYPDTFLCRVVLSSVESYTTPVYLTLRIFAAILCKSRDNSHHRTLKKDINMFVFPRNACCTFVCDCFLKGP